MERAWRVAPGTAVPLEPEGGSLAVELFEKLLAAGVDGKSSLQLSSSADLASSYHDDPALPTVEDKVTSIIRWESSKGFASGFVTGSGAGPLG